MITPPALCCKCLKPATILVTPNLTYFNILSNSRPIRVADEDFSGYLLSDITNTSMKDLDFCPDCYINWRFQTVPHCLCFSCGKLIYDSWKIPPNLLQNVAFIAESIKYYFNDVAYCKNCYENIIF
jgi:hypothetical protein